MAKYDDEDQVTYYFVINDDGKHRQVQGWTDDKDLAKFYMSFHNCKNFTLKSLTKTFSEMACILDENNQDEIQIKNIMTRDPKHHNRGIYVQVPLTQTEKLFIDAEVNSLMSSTVNYSFIESALPYLKKKYQDALKQILLTDAIGFAIHNKRSVFIESTQFDQMMILLYSFRSNFG